MSAESIGTRNPPPSGMSPGGNLALWDVEELGDELVAYHAIFAPLFARREQRHWALKYNQGQMLELERKSIEPMALALEGGDVQAMQQFISEGAWEDEPILETHRRLVAETLGDPEAGVLIIDGCDFPKQGKDSVGVGRQYCGALGKVANCQASVVACYASDRGYTLVDRRLYMPQKWFSQEYAQRREKCGVPADLSFRTQPELAWEIIEGLRGALPLRWVTFDEHFGDNPALLDWVDAAGLLYLAEVPHDTRVWLRRPRTQVPAAKGREKLCQGEPEAVRLGRVAQQLTEGDWRCYQIKEGAKGPMLAEFAFLRAVAVRQGLPGPDVWLVLRRSLGQKRELKAYLSNAPPATSQAELVRLSGMRWPVETAIEESKGELGMDHYEVRGWKGWHHHMTMTFLAHHFLLRLRIRLGGKITSLDRVPGASAAEGCAPSPRARRRDGHRSHPKNPAPELRCLSLSSSQHLAST